MRNVRAAVQPAPDPHATHIKTRLRMRAFARLIARQDPAALAADVDPALIAITLDACMKIQMFFSAYVDALRRRRP